MFSKQFGQIAGVFTAQSAINLIVFTDPSQVS